MVHDKEDASFWQDRTVLVTGANGFLGRNLVPLLPAGCRVVAPRRADYDLLDQAQVRRMFADVQPRIVLHLAGLVGGILANRSRPADFAHQNLVMGTHMIDEAFRAGVSKYVTLIGGCSYPADAASPIAETALWDGYPQEEAAPYSLAKRMMVVLAQSYRKQHGFNAIVLAPGNVYGPFDNFDLQSSHVIPALIRKFIEARKVGAPQVVAWGTGRPVRDFIYVGDACEAIVRATAAYEGTDIINISRGEPTTIRELVDTVADLTGYAGTVVWDASMPDGQMLKGFDVTRMREWLHYQPPTSLRDGLTQTIAWYEEQQRS